MTLHIPDDILKAAGLTERDMLIELACRLFDADRLDFNDARRLAVLDRPQFEQELRSRGLAIVHYTPEHWEQDRQTLRALSARRESA